MKIKSLLLLLFITVSLYAQETDSLSHYVFPEFKPGVVLLKNGVRNNANLNYNAATEEMIFDENGTLLAISEVILPQIDTVFISNERFVRLNNKFVKIIFDEPEVNLYVEYKARLIPPPKPVGFGGSSQIASSDSYSSIISDGVMYKLKLPNDYKVIPYNVFWINRNGQLSSFSRIAQLKRIYRDKRKEINNYLKEHDVKIEDEGSVVATIVFMENNL